jgi:hypothetical protein
MASINWLKASLRGKLGQVVGSSWKGIDYIKTYTKPSNPDTPKQQQTREIFKNISQLGNSILTPLNAYTRPTPQSMTGVNYMMHLNKFMFGKTGTGWDPLKLAIMSGPDLPASTITAAQIYFPGIAPAPPVAAFGWDERPGENNKDCFLAVLFDNESKKVLFWVYTGPDPDSPDDPAPHSESFDLVPWIGASSLHDVYAYLSFFKINEDGSGLNSFTSAMKCEYIPADAAKTPAPPAGT